MFTKIFTPVFLVIILLNTGCIKSKEDTQQITCQKIKSATITATTPVKIGDEIKIEVPDLGDNIFYRWIGPNNYHDEVSRYVDISYAELENQGWYYVAISENGCDTKVDSVYIDVQLEQGTAPCSPTANSVGYSNLADDNFSYVSKGVETTYGLLALQASGGGNLTVYFHPEWRSMEPEDGIYNTTNTPLFDQVDANFNKVFVTTTKQSIYWSSHEGQQVYVSHVNGKLQVKFCSLNMGGYNGYSFTTSASGNVIEK